MKFDYLVKHNGVYYPAGTEVPIETNGGGNKAPAVDVSGKVDEPKAEKPKSKKYSEEELNLPYMKLKSLAIAEGFKVDKTAKADDIKEMLRTL